MTAIGSWLCRAEIIRCIVRHSVRGVPFMAKKVWLSCIRKDRTSGRIARGGTTLATPERRKPKLSGDLGANPEGRAASRYLRRSDELNPILTAGGAQPGRDPEGKESENQITDLTDLA